MSLTNVSYAMTLGQKFNVFDYLKTLEEFAGATDC